MRIYHLVVVLRPSVKEGERAKLFETIKTWLKGVTIKKEEDLGQKALSYPIKHEVMGFYKLFSFEADTLPAGIEARLTGQDNVLRHLLIRKK